MKGSGYLPPGAFLFFAAVNPHVDVRARVHLPRACGLDTVPVTQHVGQFFEFCAWGGKQIAGTAQY